MKTTINNTDDNNLYCRLPIYMYNIVYNDRDPTDAVAFKINTYNKKESSLY